MYVSCVMYGICAILLCNCCLDGMPVDVLFVAIVAVKVSMAQLLSPRQISLSGTIKYKVYCIVVYRKEFTIEELKLDKSPGPDGLTANFYRHFWDSLRNFLFQQ